jgi:fructosamine-3-kinase
VKTRAAAPAGFFAAEADGLAWLAAAGARVPEVHAVHDEAPAFLALGWIEPGSPRAKTSEQLGRELAALHRVGAPRFGHDRDNFLGTIPQPNGPVADWAVFYRDRRLVPQLERAALPPALQRRVETLLGNMEALVGPPEPPARLHGDLWGGNVVVDAEGRPWLVDPAVSGGHREQDLAMMRLFGGFDARCFAAYAEAAPLAPGHEDRVPLYQLYYLLAHVNLFGPSWCPHVDSALRDVGY